MNNIAAGQYLHQDNSSITQVNIHCFPDHSETFSEFYCFSTVVLHGLLRHVFHLLHVSAATMQHQILE